MLLVAFTMSLTVITVVVMGILAAYAAVTGILHAFAYHSRQRITTSSTILVPSQSQAGAD
jgi:hypothetical protein